MSSLVLIPQAHLHSLSRVSFTVLLSQVQPVRGWPSSPTLTPSPPGLAHLCLPQQGRIHCVAQVEYRATLGVLQPVKGQG